MKILLKILLILTLAHSDYIQLWVDRVDFNIDPEGLQNDLYFNINYSIINSDSGVDLIDDSNEDVNNIKSFRFTLGTFNDAVNTENDLGSIFSLSKIEYTSAWNAFEAINPIGLSQEECAESSDCIWLDDDCEQNCHPGFNQFYFAGSSTDDNGVPNQSDSPFLRLRLTYDNSDLNGQYMNIRDITNSLGTQTEFIAEENGANVVVDYQWLETTWILGESGNVNVDDDTLWYWYGQDCVGDVWGQAIQDSCGVCSGGNSNHEADSDIDCNGDCFGGALIDDCGVCGGAGIPEGDCDCLGNFLGCDGECSSATEDMCGTCDANSSNDCVQDCDDVWGGSSEYQIWYPDCDIDGLADTNVPETLCGSPQDSDIQTICGFIPDCSNEFMDGDVLCGLTSNSETFDANPGCTSNSVDLCGECDGFNQHMDCQGQCWDQTPICSDPAYSNYDPTGVSCQNYVGLDSSHAFSYNDGYDDCGVCGGDNSICTGCTNQSAVNYNEDAIIYDGSCSFELYPGDANRDGTVNQNDIDGLAIFWNQYGGSRDHVSIDWYKQYATDDWEDVCAGYADTNGDGMVNHLDLSAILQNWGNLANYEYSEPSICYDDIDIASYRSNFEEILAILQNESIEDPIVRDMVEYLSDLLDTNFYPEGFKLYQNYPNPFNPITTIEFDISIGSETQINVYNVNGNLVHQHDFGYLSPGLYDYALNASDFTSGVYIYSVSTSSGHVAQKQMILIK